MLNQGSQGLVGFGINRSLQAGCSDGKCQIGAGINKGEKSPIMAEMTRLRDEIRMCKDMVLILSEKLALIMRPPNLSPAKPSNDENKKELVSNVGSPIVEDLRLLRVEVAATIGNEVAYIINNLEI